MSLTPVGPLPQAQVPEAGSPRDSMTAVLGAVRDGCACAIPCAPLCSVEAGHHLERASTQSMISATLHMGPSAAIDDGCRGIGRRREQRLALRHQHVRSDVALALGGRKLAAASRALSLRPVRLRDLRQDGRPCRRRYDALARRRAAKQIGHLPRRCLVVRECRGRKLASNGKSRSCQHPAPSPLASPPSETRCGDLWVAMRRSPLPRHEAMVSNSFQ